MAKRPASEANIRVPRDQNFPKRQRIESPSGKKPQASTSTSTAEEVNSASQLQKILVFEQGAAADLRTAIQTFKNFLDSILYPTDESADHVPRRRAILREFLDGQKSKGHTEEETIFLPNLMQAWAYAAETNFENLLSSVTAVLALLLKLLARETDFREYGNNLCKTILQVNQAKLFNRSLQHNKEHVISPALRLLTEVVSFNEGAFAKAVYWKRDFTLDPRTLARNVGLWKDQGDKAPESRKPSVRSQAVRYLLTHLKYQDELAKVELLKNANIIRALFDHLNSDPPNLAIEILNVVKNHVFLDKTIPRRTKSYILTERTLSGISSLYKYESSSEETPETHKSPAVVAQDFLLLVCTNPDMGVMLTSFGFYPPGSERDEMDEPMEDSMDFTMDIDLDSTERYDKSVPVRNVILAEFAQTLRPYSSTLQQELLLAMFQASPELVADYFLRKAAFHYDPKLTATWIGYSSFLFQAIQLPVPQYFGSRRSSSHAPPNVSIVIQSILPQPLSQKVLARCLNQKSELITFFATRVLIVAFQKLEAVLQEFRKAIRGRSRVWEQASQALVTEFCGRCPQMNTVISAFRSTPTEKFMQREAITRLLRLYYEVIPRVALNEKFDFSIPLCNALARPDVTVDAPEDKGLRILELEHLVQIARHSPNMRWWQSHESLQHSPFITLVKLIATSKDAAAYAGIKNLLVSIIREHEILQLDTKPSALDALVASLQESCPLSRTQVLEFLDDCCGRFVKRPIKYQDDLMVLATQSASADEQPKRGPFSTLLMTLLEQWAHKGGENAKEDAGPIAHWLARLLFLLRMVGEDEDSLGVTRDALVKASQKSYQQVLRDSFLWKMSKEAAKEALRTATKPEVNGIPASSPSPSPEVPTTTDVEMVDLELPPKEDEKHTGLTRWRTKEVEDAIEDGDISELLLCLCSQHAEIRLQAVMALKQLIAKIESLNNPDLLQLHLLLGEAVETAQHHSLEQKPLAYIAGVFAARAVSVLADPTHFMFPKINTVLNRAPVWDVSRLPTQLAAIVMRAEPDEEDGYHREVEWLLDWFLDGLRSPDDVEIFRSKNIFERVLGFYTSPACSIPAREKIVRLLLRATAVGGSTTLVTRSGLISWIRERMAVRDHRGVVLRRLKERLEETMDWERVDEWGSGRVKRTVQASVA